MAKHEPIEIVLAEDNSADAELALRALRDRRVANTVVWLKDGGEVLDYVFCRAAYSGRATGNPRLVLLDLKMPKVDGLEVLKALKSDESTRAIPVVVMTSSREERDLVETYRLGVNSYIVKPVDFEQFVAVVASAGYYWSVVNKIPS